MRWSMGYIAFLSALWGAIWFGPLSGRGLSRVQWAEFFLSLAEYPAAEILFILTYLVLAALFFPTGILSFAGGFVFGWQGFFWNLIGCLMAAELTFLLGRRLGRGYFEKNAGPALRMIESRLTNMGWTAVFAIRMLPGPFVFGNAVCGALGFKSRPFLTGSFAGILPGTFIAVELGMGTAKFVGAPELDWSQAPWEWLVLRVFLGVGTLAWGWKRSG